MIGTGRPLPWQRGRPPVPARPSGTSVLLTSHPRRYRGRSLAQSTAHADRPAGAAPDLQRSTVATIEVARAAKESLARHQAGLVECPFDCGRPSDTPARRRAGVPGTPAAGSREPWSAPHERTKVIRLEPLVHSKKP